MVRVTMADDGRVVLVRAAAIILVVPDPNGEGCLLTLVDGTPLAVRESIAQLAVHLPN